MQNNFSLVKLPLTWKILISLYLLTIGTGYLFTSIQVALKVGLGYSNVLEHYSKNPPQQETIHGEKFDPFNLKIIEPVTLEKLVHNRHIHIIVQSLLFLSLGGLILLTSFSEKIKITLVVLPFLSILLESGGMFLTRYLDDSFALLILAGGGLMGISFGAIFILTFYELWIKKNYQFLY
jgi:hypothetical protein